MFAMADPHYSRTGGACCHAAYHSTHLCCDSVVRGSDYLALCGASRGEAVRVGMRAVLNHRSSLFHVFRIWCWGLNVVCVGCRDWISRLAANACFVLSIVNYDKRRIRLFFIKVTRPSKFNPMFWCSIVYQVLFRESVLINLALVACLHSLSTLPWSHLVSYLSD